MSTFKYAHISQLLLVLSFCLSAPALAIEVSELRSLSRDEIIEVSNQLAPYFKVIKDRIEAQGDVEIESYEKDLKALNHLSEYPIYESAMTIWKRLEFEILKVSPSRQSRDLKERARLSLNKMLTDKDEFFVKKMTESIDLLSAARYKSDTDRALNSLNIKMLKELQRIVILKKGDTPLTSLDELVNGTRLNREAATQQLGRFSEMLKAKVIGQPEVIEALEALEWERQFVTSKDVRPDIVYLMGSPGTGKDTAAEALADALHGKDGAYHEHMYRLPIMKKEADLWQVLGSATGYVGSDSFPPFLKFLIEHSGGRYVLAKGGAIAENPDWKGSDLPGFAPPSSAVVFINEFHNWSKEIKDVFVKQALEKGIFEINNPKGGLSQIEVPVRFVVASNEGISLTTARESNGQRFGKPLSYEETLKKWEEASIDKKRLKNEIMATNGSVNSGKSSIEGISEELLSRIPERFLMLMRPLSPDNLQEIAGIELKKQLKKFEGETALNPGIEVIWENDIIQMVQGYDYNPEDNARPVLGRVKSLVVEPIIQLLKSGDLNLEKPIQLSISIKANEDSTLSLIVNAKAENADIGEFIVPIKSTEKDRLKNPIDDSEIERLANLPEMIKSRVFGVDAIADRISERVISLANQTASNQGAARSASTLVLMGLSSTGKTELSKAITEALTGDERNALVLDFSQIQSVHDFKTRVLGSRDGLGNPIASDFMKHYDRNDGNLVVVFDELSNVKDPDLLKSLYDFFREPILSTFSDGKERAMTQVKVIVTGNSGIELYKNIPRNVSMEQQMVAWEKVSRGLINSPEMQRSVLEKSFPEPLITRWGRNNIFFVPPHSYKSLKQLAQFKLAQMIKKIAPDNGRRGWSLGFASEEDYTLFVEALVEKAFNLREQGASIDSFIKDDLMAPLESKFLMGKVPSGSRVLIESRGDKKFGFYSESIEFAHMMNLDGAKGKEKADLILDEMEDKRAKQVLTAYHEVGHALSRELLFRGQAVQTEVSILPGVAYINNEWVAYLGVAKALQNAEPNITREWVIRQLAVLTAGETAERLVTKGEVHTAGKSNDMERATRLAETAVIRFGLSETWGTGAVPAGTELNTYISRLSEDRKKLFEDEVNKLINEGRALARELLVANFEAVVVPMSKKLAEKGVLKMDEMAPFFEEAKLVNVSEKKESAQSFSIKSWVRSLFSSRTPRSELRDGVFKREDLLPETFADIDQIVEQKRKDLYAQVQVPQEVPIFDSKDFEIGKSALKADCESLLVGF